MNKYVGDLGEMIAKRFLIDLNYKIISENLKVGYKEFDLIAKDGKITVFVEVKTKKSSWQGEVEEMITRKKIINLRKGAMEYCNWANINLKNIRFDLIAITLDKNDRPNIKHYKEIL